MTGEVVSHAYRRLAEKLQAFFGIAGDPIRIEGNGWATLFQAVADH